MSGMSTSCPLLTLEVAALLQRARERGETQFTCSLDLGRSASAVAIRRPEWSWRDVSYPYPEKCREGTIYYWKAPAWEPVTRFGHGLIKLKPTAWALPPSRSTASRCCPPRTFPLRRCTAQDCPRRAPGKGGADTCGGLGYFAHWCLEQGATRVVSFERTRM